MLHIVLVEPEIPQNTGNISRTCAATGSKLHLIRPLGFEITERRVRRAGLDYWPLLELEIHDSLDELFRLYPEAAENLWLTTTKAQRSYAEADYRGECWLFFGKETAGLPRWFRQAHADRCVRIPMRSEARSLNLSNAVAIVAYEALRQAGFPGLASRGHEEAPSEEISSSQ